MEKIWATGAQKLFGQVWGNSGKNPSHPQKFACSYTYDKTTIRTKVGSCSAHAKQGRLSSEGRGEILAIWAALKQLSENKNDVIFVVLLRLMKTKNLNMLLSFCQHWHLT